MKNHEGFFPSSALSVDLLLFVEVWRKYEWFMCVWRLRVVFLQHSAQIRRNSSIFLLPISTVMDFFSIFYESESFLPQTKLGHEWTKLSKWKKSSRKLKLWEFQQKVSATLKKPFKSISDFFDRRRSCVDRFNAQKRVFFFNLSFEPLLFRVRRKLN